MKHMLEPLRLTGLTHLECGQLMKRLLSDLSSPPVRSITDEPFKAYLASLQTKSANYEKALVQVRKSEETEKIQLADQVRDLAVTAFIKAVRLYASSDVPAEAEASRGLMILINSFDDIAKLNYEAESIAIDKLLADLAGPNYSTKVTQLQLERYVTRLTAANTSFKSLFGGRMVVTASTEIYDVKLLRKDLTETYNDFCDYTLAMAKAYNSNPFLFVLDLINTARKYYSDLLARRATTKTEEPQPAS